MSLLGGLFGWIVGGTDSADSTVTRAGKMIDDAIYTDQEKAATNGKILDWYLKYQEATKPQNVSRRIIALAVTGLWVAMLVLAVLSRWLEKESGAGSFSQFIFDTMNANINTPFSIIIGFYFAAHVVRGLKNGN